MQTKSILSVIVGSVLAIYIVASLLPDALETLMNVSTEGWTTSVATLFGILPLMAVIGIVILFVGIALDRL